MTVPIRIKDQPLPKVDRLAEAGMTVSYESPSGETWVLSTPTRVQGDGQSIFLVEEGLQGLSAAPEREESSSVGLYGARPVGWSLAPLELSIEYQVRADAGLLEEVVRQWRQAWITEEPGDYHDPAPVQRGRLWLHSNVGGEFWTPVSDPVFPDWPNDLKMGRMLQEQMTCRSMVGHWFGATSLHEGEVTINVDGDRPLSPKLGLIWDGRATSVTFPTGLTVHLPEIGVQRHINLDRGMSGQMTRPDGTVDSGGWSSLQGVVHGVSLRPGVDSHWVLGEGVTLEVTPRFLSPWR